MLDTLKHYRDVHGDDMIAAIEGEHSPWRALGGKIDKGTLKVSFPGGSRIQPFPAAAHNAQAARGLRPDAVLIDEGDDVSPHVVHAVCTPWFTPAWSLGMVVVAGTPRKGRYGLLYLAHSLGLSDKPEHASYNTVHATYRDCLGHGPGLVAPEAIEQARATTPGPIFHREWEANFDSAEGLVYDGWDEAFHVRRPPDGATPNDTIVGVDWGYVDPSVLLMFDLYGHGNDAQAYLTEEHYATGRTQDQLIEVARGIQERRPRATWFADPSEPASIEALRQKAHVNIRKADNRIDQGVAAVANLLHIRGDVDAETGKDSRWARLYVSPECEHTRREFVSYRRKADPRDPDQYTEDIVDKDNHAMDAARYALFGHFGMPGRSGIIIGNSPLG
jgi:hypothetical protein